MLLPMYLLYNPWNNQKTISFWMFSGGMKRRHIMKQLLKIFPKILSDLILSYLILFLFFDDTRSSEWFLLSLPPGQNCGNSDRQNTKFRSLITDTWCTRKNSRHISHDINTPDKIAGWFLEYKIHPTIQEADLLLNKILPAI